MHRRALRVIRRLICFCLLLAPVAYSQENRTSDAEERAVAAQPAELLAKHPGARVALALKGGLTINGKILSIENQRVTLASEPKNLLITIAYAEIKGKPRLAPPRWVIRAEGGGGYFLLILANLASLPLTVIESFAGIDC